MAFSVAGGGDLSGGIRTEDGGKTDAGVLAAADPDVPVVECRGSHADNDLPWPGHRRGPLFNPKIAGIAEFPRTTARTDRDSTCPAPSAFDGKDQLVAHRGFVKHP